MKSFNRFIFQVLFWLGLWVMLWVIEAKNTDIAWENLVILLFQIIMIGGIIYFAVPILLLKKRTLIFWLLIVVCIFSFSIFSSQLLVILGFQHPHPPPPAELGNRPPPMGPSRFIINFLILCVTAMVAIVVETFLFAQKKEQENIMNKNILLQSELRMLKFQINPHFLFNTLNNIYTLSVIDSTKTQQSINYLSIMLRYVLYECEQEFVVIHQEITYIENYLALFSLKSTNPFSIKFDKNIKNPNAKIAPMLLIPFIENALKHSHIEKRGTSFIDIQIFEERGAILLVVENSKPAQTIQKDKVGGIGLENVKKRLAILYPNQHNLLIEDKDTFKVTLQIDRNETT